MRYDTTQPRLAIISPVDPLTCEQRTREIGQAYAWGEALFWLTLGYQVEISQWNGQFFETSQTFYPADM